VFRRGKKMVRKTGRQGHARPRQNDYSKIINDISEDGTDIISTSPGW